MDKASFFVFNGVEYPTVASARAIDAYCKKCGKTLETAFDGFEALSIDDMLFLLSELLKAGYKWSKIDGGEAKLPPSFDELMDFIDLADMPKVLMCIITTMTKALNVSVKAEPQKNG